MRQVTLAYKALNPHELACHFIAQMSGAYARDGLAPTLLDASQISESQLVAGGIPSVGCGSAVLARATDLKIVIVLVTCCRPMFWLTGGPRLRLVDDLPAARIASFPPSAPPAVFLRTLLRRRGLDPDRDVELLPVPTDAARLALVDAGDADAALLSSGSALDPVRRRDAVLDFGAELSFPSTGLAVGEAMLEASPDLVSRLAHSLQTALVALRREPKLAARALAAGLGLSHTPATDAVALVTERFTPDGLADPGSMQGDIDAVLAETTGSNAVDVSELFRLNARPL